MNWPDLSKNKSFPISPELNSFVAYLHASGWIQADADSRTSLWQISAAGEDKSLVLPVRQEVTDYRERVYDALRLLSYVERRTTTEIMGDIIYGPSDTVAIRLTPDAPSGQAPLPLAYDAISALRSYVIGSGAALEDHSLVLPARRSRQAEVYANGARVSTLPGSFILSLTLPLLVVVDSLDQGVSKEEAKESESQIQGKLLEVPPQPFGRRVTNRMAAVARYAQSLAEDVSAGDKRLPSFGRPEVDAPNATELEALSGFGGPDRNPYQLRFAQSPVTANRTSQAPLRITPGQQHVMAEAAHYLRTQQPRQNVTVQGLVVNLARNGRHGPGEVIIQGIIDDSGKDRRIHVDLSEADYDEALAAHGEGRHVTVRGDLEMRGNWKWLRNATRFAIIPGFEFDE